MDINIDEFNQVNYGHIRDANNLIDKIIDENGKSFDIVLDVGCGSGNVTALLSQRLSCNKIIAIDVDMKMIKYARHHYTAPQIDYCVQDIGVEWHQLDPKLRQLEGRVELVFSNRVLHWVENKSLATQNLYRFLSPKGKIYSNITTLLDLFHDLVPDERSKYENLLRIPSKDEQIEIWRKAFCESGFKDIEIEFSLLNQLYPSDHFKNILLPYFPNLTKKYLIETDPIRRNQIMAEGLRDIVKKAIVRHHCRELPNALDGMAMFEMNYGQCRIIANK